MESPRDKIAVNSAAVERLFSTFGNIQNKRKNAFVHERLQKFAKVNSMLPLKPKQEKASQQAISILVYIATQQAAAKAEAACAQAAQATEDMADHLLMGKRTCLYLNNK
ncbi:hypothetical protein ABBQ32_004458 [Trebouxia sp. C0010 RCD-2024]